MPIPEKIQELNDRPEALKLLNIYASITNTTMDKTLAEMSGKDFSKFKEKLAEVLIDTICPIGKKKKLNKNKDYLINVLKTGSSKAQKLLKKF